MGERRVIPICPYCGAAYERERDRDEHVRAYHDKTWGSDE